jgi:hypothetical protein
MGIQSIYQIEINRVFGGFKVTIMIRYIELTWFENQVDKNQQVSDAL